MHLLTRLTIVQENTTGNDGPDAHDPSACLGNLLSHLS